MISFDEAHRIVLDSAGRMGTEKVPLGDCLGRVLGEDAVSDMDMPPHDLSAMDGLRVEKATLTSPCGRLRLSRRATCRKRLSGRASAAGS